MKKILFTLILLSGLQGDLVAEQQNEQEISVQENDSKGQMTKADYLYLAAKTGGMYFVTREVLNKFGMLALDWGFFLANADSGRSRVDVIANTIALLGFTATWATLASEEWQTDKKDLGLILKSHAVYGALWVPIAHQVAINMIPSLSN